MIPHSCTYTEHQILQKISMFLIFRSSNFNEKYNSIHNLFTILITFGKFRITCFLAKSAPPCGWVSCIHAFTFSLETCFPTVAGLQTTLIRVMSPVQAHTLIGRCAINLAAGTKSTPRQYTVMVSKYTCIIRLC